MWNACFIGCGKYYDDNFGWITSGPAQPVLFITTEQELSEVQTMMLAFLSNVNEEHILNGLYAEGEEERVNKAAEILEQSPIYIEELPDFSLKDVEDKIKKGLREYNIKYVFHDYIHTSLKILEEINEHGESKTYEDLWLADYKEIPVDKTTFLTDDYYLGRSNDNGRSIYPAWMGVMQELERTGNQYYEIVLTGATRTGKTSTAKIFARAVNCLDSIDQEPCNECEICKEIFIKRVS